MNAKPPTLTLAGRGRIALSADNVRLLAKCVASEPQQADHSPSGLGNPANVGRLGMNEAHDVPREGRRVCSEDRQATGEKNGRFDQRHGTPAAAGGGRTNPTDDGERGDAAWPRLGFQHDPRISA